MDINWIERKGQIPSKKATRKMFALQSIKEKIIVNTLISPLEMVVPRK